MTERDYQLLNLRYRCPLLPRDDLLKGRVPTTPTIASMMAGLQVQEALKLLHGMPVAAGSAHVFNGVSNQFYTTQLPFKSDCLSHETYPEPAWLPLGVRTPLSTIFEQIQHSSARLDPPLQLRLERELVVAFDCQTCQVRSPVLEVRQRVAYSRSICPQCGNERRAEQISEVDEGSELALNPLGRLGVPPGDVIRIDGANSTGFYRLAEDGQPAPADPLP